MLVKELIESLKYMDQDAEVHFSYNYGDYWRTEVAPAVGRVDEGAVVYSEYHRMDKMLEEQYDVEFDEDTGEEVKDETLRRVVVLS
jgi:hypothetical protein